MNREVTAPVPAASRPLERMLRRSAAALLAFGCACGPTKETAAPETPGRAPTQAPEPAPARVEAPPEHELPPEFQQALDRVSEIRGLSFRRPVELRRIAAEEVRAYVRRRLDRDLPPEAISGTGEILFALGHVEAAFELASTLEALYAAELMGLYDPDDKVMYLRHGLGPKEAEMALYHELVHALQDQHFDLGARVAWQKDQGDRIAAVHALAEGEATSVMLLMMLGVREAATLDGLDASALSAALAEARGNAPTPGIIERMLVAPYVDGLAFVQELRKQGGWGAIDSAWQRPPDSTEQLLHSEKYRAAEAPEAVAEPHLPGFQVTYREVMGEQSVRLVLEGALPIETATAAASGWAGDLIAVLEDGPRRAVVWRLRYDTPELAERAARALASAGVRAGPGAKPALVRFARGRACSERKDRGPYAVTLKGRELVVFAGPYVRQAATTAPAPTVSEAKSAAHCSEALRIAAALLEG